MLISYLASNGKHRRHVMTGMFACTCLIFTGVSVADSLKEHQLLALIKQRIEEKRVLEFDVKDLVRPYLEAGDPTDKAYELCNALGGAPRILARRKGQQLSQDVLFCSRNINSMLPLAGHHELRLAIDVGGGKVVGYTAMVFYKSL